MPSADEVTNESWLDTAEDMLRQAQTGYKSSSREWSSSSWLSSQPTLPSSRLVSSSSMADSRGGAGVSQEVGCGEGGLGTTDTLRRDRFLLRLLRPEHPETINPTQIWLKKNYNFFMKMAGFFLLFFALCQRLRACAKN